MNTHELMHVVQEHLIEQHGNIMLDIELEDQAHHHFILTGAHTSSNNQHLVLDLRELPKPH